MSQTGPTRCLVSVIIVTIVIIGILATTSLILGFLMALYSPNAENNDGNNGGVASTMASEYYDNQDQGMVSANWEYGYADQKIWLIHVGEYNHKVAYLDDTNQQARGFEVDIVNAVCRWSRRRCRLVFDQYGNCFNNGVGRGLNEGYYHACAGWTITYERLKAGVIFGDEYEQASGTIWVTRRGNPTNFDPRDVSGVNIGFVTGWNASPTCLNSLRNTQGLPISPSQEVFYDTIQALVDDLNDGTIGAGFISDIIFDGSLMEQVSDSFQSCNAGQLSIMTRPTQTGKEFIDWWNAGLQQFLYSREYGEVCDRLTTVHGDKDGGDENDLCLTEYI